MATPTIKPLAASRHIGRYPVMFGLGIALIAAPIAGGLQSDIDREKLLKVKAAFLLNFAKFVTWPEDDAGDRAKPIVIGVLGRDPFGQVLDRTVQGNHVRDRTLVIRRLSPDYDRDRNAMRECHILYVAESENDRWPRIAAAVGDSAVLVVGESADFALRGGMIAFVLSKGRVVFHMNRQAIERTSLKVSSKLYGLAPVIHDGSTTSSGS